MCLHRGLNTGGGVGNEQGLPWGYGVKFDLCSSAFYLTESTTYHCAKKKENAENFKKMCLPSDSNPGGSAENERCLPVGYRVMFGMK
jgi:hypothetical protein